jgi:hypothetical protein
MSLICDNSVTTQNLWFFQERHLKVLKCCNFLWAKRRHSCSPAAKFCKLRYDTRPVKSASANISFYTNNSKMPNFELWHSCRKWTIYTHTHTHKHRVIRKSLWDFQPLQYGSRDGHAEGKHVNRRTDTPSFCPTLQVPNMSTLGVCLGCCAAEFRSSGGNYELPCI